MKKLILSLQFFMILLVPCSMYSMFYLNKLASYITAPKDPSKDPSINTDGICWLNKLPKDIQNEIAEYLTFNDRETDAEFIERTKKLLNSKKSEKFVSQAGYVEDHYFKNRFGFSMTLQIYSKHTEECIELYQRHINEKQYYVELFEFAPNHSKVILAEDFGPSVQAHAFDIVSQKEIYKKSLASGTPPIAIAISSDGTTLATVINGLGHSLLTVENILNNKTEIIETSQTGIKRLDFNKQGTKIMYQTKSSSSTNSLASQEEHKKKSKKTLAAYFKQKGICKEIN